VKAHILFTFRAGPWGGCNQFLTGLRDAWREAGAWADSPDEADVVLFDSCNNAHEVIAAKRKLPKTPFVHRLDGPISAYRGRDLPLDRLIHSLNAALADGTIFQSEYSRTGNLSLGMTPTPRQRVIGNAPRADCFVPRQEERADGRVRVLAASFSPNPNKGFDILAHLDAHLDFDRYELTFVGNSPIRFTNIVHLPPQDSATLAKTMHSNDIFLAASRLDPCSNALLEALACGLPAVARNSGGHPGILGQGGELFDGPEDVLAAIDAVAADIPRYRRAIRVRRMEQAAAEYLDFLREVRDTARPPKTLAAAEALVLAARLRLHAATKAAVWLVRTRLFGRTA